MSQLPEKPEAIKEPAVLLRRLKQSLQDRVNSLDRSLRSAGQPQAGIDPVQVLLLNSERSTILQVLDVLQELESGSNVNADGDFLGADNLPPIEETTEWMEL